jgi:DNA-binding LacI/PurR family transcriptional regulator
MRRRHILILLGVVLITPLRAAAQSRSGKTWRIGFFGGPPSRDESVYGAFVPGMRQLGHTEGQDFIVDSVVYNADKPDQAAREMVQHHVDLILATT